MKRPNADNFDLRQLAIFCKIVELKNFTRAGEALFLTQPTLSARIADLEKKVGARLLDRRAREVVPTKAGEILYRHARELLRLRDSVVQELSSFLGEMRGELLIGASSIPGEYILPSLIARFQHEAPGVMVRMVVADSAGIIEQVSCGKVEVGVVGSRPQRDSLRSSKLEDDELVLIVPRNHPFGRKKAVALDEVVRQPFVDREPGSGTRKAVEAALRHHGVRLDRDLNVVVEAGSNEAVKQCVEAGIGITVLSRRAVGCEGKIGTVKIVPIRDVRMTRSFYLIQSIERTPSPICREFVRFVQTLKKPE